MAALPLSALPEEVRDMQEVIQEVVIKLTMRLPVGISADEIADRIQESLVDMGIKPGRLHPPGPQAIAEFEVEKLWVNAQSYHAPRLVTSVIDPDSLRPTR
jgi:hypothetical protein